MSCHLSDLCLSVLRNRLRLLRWVLGPAILLFCMAGAQADEGGSVTLQLRWRHQFQFAGYYAALEKGYYRDAGLDVRLEEAKPGVNPLETVLEGKAQYGVGTSELLLERQRGVPVVVLGVIFQHSPLAIAARRTDGIINIHSLAGQRVMIEPGAAELLAYLRHEGIDPDSLKVQDHGQTVEDLLAGRVDAMSVYITDELYELRQKKVDAQLFRPEAGGVDFYGDNLFTTQAELDAHPDRVRAFRAASLKGWAYAMEHPQEIIDLILARYSSRHSREHLLFEAEQMASLIQPHMVEIGYMHPGRWQHIQGTYAELGLVPPGMKMDGFLYATAPHSVLPVWLWPALGAAFVLGLVVAGAVLAILSYRRRMAALESRSLALLEEAPFPVAVAQRGGEGKILYLNRCAEEHFKVQRADVIGKTTEYFWGAPEKRAEMLARLEREGGRVVGAEVQILDLARRPLWLLMSVASVEFAREAAYLFSFHDITRRKQMEAALRDSEARFRAVAENAYDVIWTMDANGRFTYVSPSVERLRGYTPEEVMAQDMAHSLTPDSLAKAADGMAHLLRTGELLKRHWELEQPCKDGSTVWTDLILSPLKDDGGRLTGLLGITRDVTAERQLRQDLQTRSVAIEAAAEGIVITDRDGIIEYANPAFCEMSLYPLEELVGQRTAKLKSGVHGPDFYRQLWSTIIAGHPWRGEVVNRRKDGMLYHELLTIAPVMDEGGQVVRYVAVKHDITERKRIEQRLEHLAHFDLLTDLPNRTLFFDRLQQAFSRAQRYREGLAVLMLDLDGFKAVNDNLSHQAGDLLLAAFARRLKKTVRQSDTAARMGGDEFTVLLHGIAQSADGVAAADKILTALEEAFDILGHSCSIGASIGIALFATGYATADALLQGADAAMYEAKRAGKGRWVVASEPPLQI